MKKLSIETVRLTVVYLLSYRTLTRPSSVRLASMTILELLSCQAMCHRSDDVALLGPDTRINTHITVPPSPHYHYDYDHDYYDYYNYDYDYYYYYYYYYYYWRRGVVASIVHPMNEVTLRRAQLVLGWVTIFGWVYHHAM